jgi:hypothetical protein
MQTREFSSQKLPPLSTRGLWSLLIDNGPATTKFGSLTHVWFWWCAAIFWFAQGRRDAGDSPLALRRSSLVVWPLFIYLAFLAITISSDKSFGWYRIPMLPFMAIAAAWCVGEIMRDGNVMLAAALCLAPLVDAAYWAVCAPATEHPLGFRLTIVGPLAALFATRLLPERWRKPSVQAIASAAVAATFALMALAVLEHWYTYRLEY